jgi:hypothetical protein
MDLSNGTPPREWAERLYNISQWTPMPRGALRGDGGARTAHTRYYDVLCSPALVRVRVSEVVKRPANRKSRKPIFVYLISRMG